MKTLNNINRWNTFRGKIFAIFSLSSITAMSFLTIIWIVYGGNAVRNSVNRDLKLIAERSAEGLDLFLADKSDNLKVAAELLSYPDNNLFRVELMLKRLTIEFRQFKRLTLYDSSNVPVASNSPSRSSLPEEALAVVRKGKTYRSPMLFTKDNLPYIRIAVPLFWQGRVFRVLEAEIDILQVWEKVDSIEIGRTGRASIIAEDGTFMADPEKEKTLKRVTWQEVARTKVVPSGKSSAFEIKDRSGKRYCVANAPIHSMNWQLLIMQEHGEAMQFLNIMTYNALFIMLLTLVASYFISRRLAHEVSTPIEELHRASQEFANGNLEYRLPEMQGEEMSGLARSFNEMARSISEKKNLDKLAAVGRLARDVSHEINNPLAIMKNYIFIITKKKMKEDDPNQQYLRIIDGEIDRVARIIRAFNDFYHGTQSTVNAEVDPISTLMEVLQFCREDLEGKGISVQERVDGEAKVMADRDKLKQVFLNLIKNAGEAMPEGGNLTVDGRVEDRKVNISITDTGTGISAEHIEKLFTPFFSTKGVKGTGLGLSVSYGIIKNFNGNIEVESEEGKGTTFKVTLPVI